MRLLHLSLLLSLLTTGLFAQTFIEVTTPLPFEPVVGGTITFADVDNDDDEDVLITGGTLAGPVAKLYFNNGEGVFSEVLGTPFIGVSHSSVAFADIDGDNDLDVFIAGEASAATPSIKYYLNDGSGSFTLANENSNNGASFGSVACTDVDGDGDQDVLISGYSGISNITDLYINDGNGAFLKMSGTPFPGLFESTVAFADVDGDGDHDALIFGRKSLSTTLTRLYLNDGSGIYTESAGTKFSDVYDGSIEFADVDGDGDQDFLMTGIEFDFFGVTRLYINDGMGVFTKKSYFHNVKSGTGNFSDIDNDGDPDVLIMGSDFPDQVVKLYSNNGAGVYSLVPDVPFISPEDHAVAFSDIDGDGDEDVLLTGDYGGIYVVKLYTNELFPTRVEDEFAQKTQWTIQPNPAQNSIQINGQSLVPQNGLISLYDLTGRLIFQQIVAVIQGENSISIDLQSCHSGHYYLHVVTDQEVDILPVVIQK